VRLQIAEDLGRGDCGGFVYCWKGCVLECGFVLWRGDDIPKTPSRVFPPWVGVVIIVRLSERRWKGMRV